MAFGIAAVGDKYVCRGVFIVRGLVSEGIGSSNHKRSPPSSVTYSAYYVDGEETVLVYYVAQV